MNTIDLLGLAAATLTTASFVPQVVHLWRSRNAESISLLTFMVFSVGIVLWLIYGLMLHAWPIIIANIVSLVLVLIIIALTIRYRRKPPGR